MEKKDFDLLTESLEQAVAHKNGDKSVARSKVVKIGKIKGEWLRIKFVEDYLGLKLKWYQKVWLMMWRPTQIGESGKDIMYKWTFAEDE